MRPTKLILVIAAGALALACGNPAPPANSAGAAPPGAAVSRGEVVTHADAGIRFEVPAGWKSEADGERYDLESGDGEVSVTFWVPPEEHFADAAAAIGEELRTEIEDLKFDGEPKEDKHNDMEHVGVTGSGKSGGKDVVFSADLLQARKSVIVLTYGSLDAFRKHRDDYTKLIGSIRKVGLP